jgi:hypothetical protein
MTVPLLTTFLKSRLISSFGGRAWRRGDGSRGSPPQGPHSPEQNLLEVVAELSQVSSLSHITRIHSEIVLALALGQMLKKRSEEGRGVITRRISLEGGVE